MKMNYVKKCVVSRLESELINGDLSDLGNSIGEVVAKFIDDKKMGWDQESFLAGINHGLNKEKTAAEVNNNINETNQTNL